jgi:hypothetical protein
VSESVCGGGYVLDGQRVGCGEPLRMDGPWVNGYRCVDCDTPFCKTCIREHFRKSATSTQKGCGQ